MYTKNAQIRISLLNYSHSSINLSFDVLYGLFRQCPILYHCTTARSCTIGLLLCKTNSFFEMLYFWWKSSNSCDAVSYFRIVSALCGKLHGKTLCSIYCWSLAKFTEKIGLGTVNSFPIQSFKFIQIHSFCLVRYYAGLDCFGCF